MRRDCEVGVRGRWTGEFIASHDSYLRCIIQFRITVSMGPSSRRVDGLRPISLNELNAFLDPRLGPVTRGFKPVIPLLQAEEQWHVWMDLLHPFDEACRAQGRHLYIGHRQSVTRSLDRTPKRKDLVIGARMLF